MTNPLPPVPVTVLHHTFEILNGVCLACTERAIPAAQETLGQWLCDCRSDDPN